MQKHTSRRLPGAGRQRGFNLLEMMVVVIILGIVMAAGGSTFRYVVNSGRITNPANELLATMQLARMEAIRRGARVIVCRSDNPDATTPTCTTTAGNWGGWLAYVDANRNSAMDTGEAVLRTGLMRSPATMRSSAAAASNQVVFRPDGMARTTAGALLDARIRVCIPQTVPTDNARDVVIGRGSRFAVVGAVAAISAGACAVPSDT